MKRILVIINKNWEADPIVAVLMNKKARPGNFPANDKPPSIHVTDNSGKDREIWARALFRSPKATAEVWCVQDLMDPNVSSSSTFEKARVLPALFAIAHEAELVLAIGTAAFPGEETHNGCVTVGTNCFIYDPYAAKPNPQSPWTSPQIGKLLATQPAPFLRTVDQDLRAQIESRFLRTSISPAAPPVMAVSADYVALSSANVTDPSYYSWVDAAAMSAFAAAKTMHPIGSVETTLGVIRALSDAPFTFVAGIANRVGCFNFETASRDYTQNFVAAHNAGIVLAWMLPLLCEL